MEKAHRCSLHIDNGTTDKSGNFLVRLMVSALRVYQYGISPFLGNHCRFYPSCSQYTIEVIKQEGVWRGIYLSVRRLSRCHPWNQGGIDLPPGQITGDQTGYHP